jgi:hypothetical protein
MCLQQWRVCHWGTTGEVYPDEQVAKLSEADVRARLAAATPALA